MTALQPADPEGGGEVPATSSLETVIGGEWEVVVIGAGPAGAAVAVRLASRGVAVLLIDAAAMPRPKLCGCCLSQTALAELAALERLAPVGSLVDGIPAGGRPLERVRLATAAVTAVVPMPRGGVVSREALDADGVRRAIAAGAAWLPRVRVSGLVEDAADVTVSLVAAEAPPDCCMRTRITTRLVVIAAGLADTVRVASGGGESPRVIASDSRVGLGATLPPAVGGPPAGELVMAVSRNGYCGVVRLEDGRVDIAAAVDRELLAATAAPAAAIAALLTETGGARAAQLGGPVAVAQLAAATFRGTPPLTRRRAAASAGGRIVRVGDAAGYVEPFTGEGMGWALASARLWDEAIAPLITPAGRLGDDVAGAGIRYARVHGRHFAAHHARCRRVSLVVRRPWLVGPAFRLARLAPAVAARVVPLVIGGAAPPKARG